MVTTFLWITGLYVTTEQDNRRNNSPTSDEGSTGTGDGQRSMSDLSSINRLLAGTDVSLFVTPDDMIN